MDDSSPADLLATPIPFSQWLSGFPDDAEVAITCDSARCPLAHFLRDHCKNAYVVEFYAVFGRDITRRPYACDLPEWATHFVRLIDREKGNGHTKKNPVTAADCRSILAQVS